ncbi:MAG TPA: hypothetical protein VFW86_04190, partial [Candidatus Limnocylindrales bacterium]|nr:hypothetical protein [Candidatus Limnocylindrales bacterium]
MRAWLPPSSTLGQRIDDALTTVRSLDRGLAEGARTRALTTHDRGALAIAAVAFVLGLTGVGSSDPIAMDLTIGIALVLLIGGSWWLQRAWSDGLLGRVAIPVAVAAATPLLLFPATARWSTLAVLGFFAVGVASAVQLVVAVAREQDLHLAEALRRIDERARYVLALGGVGALLVVWLLLQVLPAATVFGLLTTLCLVVPAAFLIVGRALAPDGAGGEAVNVSTAAFGVAVLSPAIAWFSVFASAPYNLNLWPIVAWSVALVGARHLTIQPVLRQARRATLQRDVVVAAMEAERSRLAADLHDEALQDLTLLVRRLDAAGDAEGAEMARHVADRLRAICGDLRLPILDDLGAGPALEWLVERIERISGGEVRLERADPVRPPPDVELAIFRVAQEALANAVRH